MGDDEVATVKTITEYREIFSSIVTQYNGRVVDSPGDNILSEFASVVDAVQCAVEIQKVLKAKNEALPENRRMIFRIGVNLGDVIHEDDRIYGDGVNIAARIESLADGGGICISGTAYEHIENKLALGYEFFGEHSVKNITKPIKVYKVPMGPGDVVKKAKPKLAKNAAIAVAIAMIFVVGAVVWKNYSRTDKAPVELASKKTPLESTDEASLPLPDKPSIAVLPFDNMSGDPKQRYFSDGITEQIISSLSKAPQLFVIARNSSFTYRGKPVKVQQVARDLGVRYVLEGSVQRSEDQVRITAQLVDAISGNHIWSENYDRKIKDIFALQDEITKEILTALQVKLTGGEQARLLSRGTNNLAAYLKYLQGENTLCTFNKDTNVLARQLFEEAIALDPNFAAAYCRLAWTYLMDVYYGISPKEAMKKAMELAHKALAIDDSNSAVHSLLGEIWTRKGQNEKAIAEGERAVQINPNSADAYFYLGRFLHFAGRNKEAVELLKKALRLNPIPPPHYFLNLGLCYQHLRMQEDAIKAFNETIRRTPNYVFAHMRLAASYTLLGRDEEARIEANEVLKINPKFRLGPFKNTIQRMYKNQADVDLVIDAMRKAGLPYEEASKIPEKPSIAVLAFDNFSEDKNQEYFSDGMSEDLITDLSKISDLFVKSRKSSFVFKGKQMGAKEIAKKLKVQYILEGSVRRSGNQIRVNAQLIDAATGNHLWAERYDEKIDNIFEIQDKITKKIVAALALKLTPDEQERIADKGTNNIAAYDALLKARANFNMATVEGYKNAISLFEKAIKLDPNYGAAYAGLAGVYDTLSHLAVNRKQLGMSYQEIRLKEREALNAGLKHNPVAKTYSTNSVMLAFQYRPEEALAEAKKAQMMAPNDPNVLWQLAPAFFVNGKPEVGIELAKKALELDPACLF
jgi:adenylate cyclase